MEKLTKVKVKTLSALSKYEFHPVAYNQFNALVNRWASHVIKSVRILYTTFRMT